MFEFELFALDFEWPALDFDFDLPDFDFEWPALEFDWPDFDFEMGRICSNYPNSNNNNNSPTRANNCYGPCCSKPGGMPLDATPKSDGRRVSGYALRAALWPARG